MQKKKATITGDILKEKAHEIQLKLPQYEREKEPSWSNGWLGRFKRRHNIKEYIYHGEAGTADVFELEAIKQMEEL